MTDATIVSVLVRGELRWHGCVAHRCYWADCGNTRDWMLHLVRTTLPDGHFLGTFASAGCAQCLRRSEGVLLYPEMVRALAVAADGQPIDADDAARVLDGIGWRPHTAHCEYPSPDDPSASEEFRLHGRLLAFVPWEKANPEHEGTVWGSSPWAFWCEWWPTFLDAVAGAPHVPQPERPPWPECCLPRLRRSMFGWRAGEAGCAGCRPS